jgi:hypothetical protein
VLAVDVSCCSFALTRAARILRCVGARRRPARWCQLRLTALRRAAPVGAHITRPVPVSYLWARRSHVPRRFPGGSAGRVRLGTHIVPGGAEG